MVNVENKNKKLKCTADPDKPCGFVNLGVRITTVTSPSPLVVIFAARGATAVSVAYQF